MMRTMRIALAGVAGRCQGADRSIRRMKAYQLFQYASPDLAAEIVKAMQAEQREAYRAALAKLAEQKRLRPIFIQRKSRDDQARWISNQLKLRVSDEIAESLLQVWLIKCQQKLIITFLDETGIEHDGEGSIEDLPESIDPAKLDKAIESVLADHPAEVVAIYLRVFQLQEGDGWTEIAKVLDTDPRLRLAQQPEPEAAPAEAPAKATKVPAEAAPAPGPDADVKEEAAAEAKEEATETPAAKPKAKKKAAAKKAVAKKSAGKKTKDAGK